MARMRIPILKLYGGSFTNSGARLEDMRACVASVSKIHHTGDLGYSREMERNGYRLIGLSPTSYAICPTRNVFDACFSKRSRIGNLGFQGILPFAGINHLNNPRPFSSASEGGGVPQSTGVAANSDGANIGGNGGDDWVAKLKELWQSSVEAAKYSSEKAKEASDELVPHVHQWLDAHPYLRDVIVPVSGTLIGTLIAWSFLPRLFRRFHKYSVEGPGSLLAGNSLLGPVPYENSFWGALEVPVRYFVTFMAFLEIGQMVAPTVIASAYVAQAWRGGVVVALVWFLHRWKTNVIHRALASKDVVAVRRDKLLALDKISSVGLFVVGAMSLAEACGVAVQSVLTVGGIGGVATAFASKDILGNVLSGLSVQIAQPFSVGDTIKAGSVEGQVVEMGLTTTLLLTAEKFPVTVPNSMFSSQIIVNKSRAKWRSVVRKIPLQTDDIDKVATISENIKSMLRSNPNVYLDMEAPYCFLSQIERSYAELTLGCNLKNMNKDAEQNILLEAVRIVKQHGASLGSTQDGFLN
nr:mechanosensitive ion channel protein B076847 [Torenia fournieri]